MKKIGVFLIVLGLLGFILSSVSFSTQETVVDAGPLQVQQEKEKTLPIPPYAAAGVIAVGGALLLVDYQRNG